VLAVGYVGLQRVAKGFGFERGPIDFHLEPSLCEPYIPYREIRLEE